MNLRNLLKNTSRLLILGHQNADPDAICSMISFSRLYSGVNPNGSFLLACEDVSKLSNQVLSHFAQEIDIVSTTDELFDLIVMLDTNSRFQLGANLSSVLHNPSKTLVIDHHEPNPEIESIAEHVIVDHTTSSTCEMMVSIFDDVGIELDDTTANLLLTGMIFDTRRFFYANRKSLETTLRLLEAGADYERCVNALIIIADRSERIARLKAAGRLQIHQVDEWVIATSKIGAYEASACRGIIELGADVAIIGGKTSQGDVRISSRSTRRFSTNTGVNLGTDVMEPLGELIGGEGGGHANAAGANGVRKRDEALKKSVDLIRKAISRNLEEGRNPKVSEG